MKIRKKLYCIIYKNWLKKQAGDVNDVIVKDFYKFCIAIIYLIYIFSIFKIMQYIFISNIIAFVIIG